jgi:Ca2+-binding RTX toxin-like protein
MEAVAETSSKLPNEVTIRLGEGKNVAINQSTLHLPKDAFLSVNFYPDLKLVHFGDDGWMHFWAPKANGTLHIEATMLYIIGGVTRREEIHFVVKDTDHSGTGTAAANQMAGGRFDDKFDGLGGDDTITAKGGNDVLTGGTGDDILTGGDGADRFVFKSGDGHDTITDFKRGVDHLRGIRLNTGVDTPDGLVVSYGNGDSVLFAGLHLGTTATAADHLDFAQTEGHHANFDY